VTHGVLFGVFARHPGAEADPLLRVFKDGILRIRAQLTTATLRRLRCELLLLGGVTCAGLTPQLW
jgi:hypothetical protein